MRKASIFYPLLIMIAGLLVLVPTPCFGSAGSCLEFEHHWPYGEAWSVEYANGFVAYSAGSVLRFIQLTDPENPVQLGEVILPRHAHSIELVPEQSIALVACLQSGLQVIDYSNPQDPIIVSVLDDIGYAWTSVAKGTVAFVGTSDSFLSFDFSDPTNLQVLDSPDPTIAASEIVISGNLMLVKTSSEYLVIYDISDPSDPVAISTTDIGRIRNLAVSGQQLFGAYENSIVCFDMSDPTHPVQIGSGQSSLVDWFRGVSAADSFIFGTAFGVGVQVFELTAENEIVEIGLWESNAYTRDIRVFDDIAAVADGFNGLQILDVSEPAIPSPLSAIDGIGSLNRVVEKGGFFIAAESGHGLRVIDLNSPLAEQTVARLPLPPSATDLALINDVAIVTAGSGGVYAVDLASPLNPTLMGNSNVTDEAYRVVVQPPLAYVAGGTGGLRIFDCSDPSNMEEIGSWLDPGVRFTVVSISGNLAYLLSPDRDEIFVQVDVSTPSDPIPLSFGGNPYQTRYSRTINAFGGRLFYCSSFSNFGPLLTELDPDDIEDSFIGLGNLTIQNSCWDLAATESRLFVPQLDSILTCGFAENGTIPVYGQERFPGYSRGLSSSPGRLLANSESGGFVVFNVGFFCDGFETGDSAAWSAATATKNGRHTFQLSGPGPGP